MLPVVVKTTHNTPRWTQRTLPLSRRVVSEGSPPRVAIQNLVDFAFSVYLSSLSLASSCFYLVLYLFFSSDILLDAVLRPPYGVREALHGRGPRQRAARACRRAQLDGLLDCLLGGALAARRDHCGVVVLRSDGVLLARSDGVLRGVLKEHECLTTAINQCKRGALANSAMRIANHAASSEFASQAAAELLLKRPLARLGSRACAGFVHRHATLSVSETNPGA